MGRQSIAITGATGFIGRCLVSALAARDAEVIALTRPGSRPSHQWRTAGVVSSVVGSDDIECLDRLVATLLAHRIEIVFHLAADNRNNLGGESPWTLFESNIRLSYMLYEACRVAGVKKIVSVASREADALSVDRAAKLQPYAASKIALEVIARSFRDSYGLPVVLLKPDNVYGGGDPNPRRLIPWAIREHLEGRMPSVPQANLSTRRGYLYVDDMVSALIAAAEAELQEQALIFSVSALETHSVGEVLRAIGERFGVSPDKGSDDPQSEAQRDAGLFGSVPLTGFVPTTSFSNGLDLTVQWYRSKIDDNSSRSGVGPVNEPVRRYALDERTP